MLHNNKQHRETVCNLGRD